MVASLRDELRPSGWLQQGREAEPSSGPHSFERAVSPVTQPPADRLQETVSDYRSASAAGNTAQTLVPQPVPAPGPPDDQLLLHGNEPRQGGFFSSLQLLGQFHQSYLLCQDGDDLLLIDQHAAHERIGFETLRRSYLAGRVERQQLLFPELLELDFRSADALQEQCAELETLGFELEPFGGTAFVLKAVPALLRDSKAGQLVVDVALEMERIGKSGQLQERIDEILILMACHGVLRANQALTREESVALLRELDRVDFKAHCPHGRPVMQRLRLAEIEKLFRRQ